MIKKVKVKINQNDEETIEFSELTILHFYNPKDNGCYTLRQNETGNYFWSVYTNYPIIMKPYNFQDVTYINKVDDGNIPKSISHFPSKRAAIFHAQKLNDVYSTEWDGDFIEWLNNKRDLVENLRNEENWNNMNDLAKKLKKKLKTKVV